MTTKYVKICIAHHYIVPADNEDAIEYAKEALVEDLTDNDRDIWTCVEVLDAPEAQEDAVAEFIQEYIQNQQGYSPEAE